MSSPAAGLPPPESSQPCPCGSGKTYEACCQPFISGQRLPATAEQLMRSRFTAHVANDPGYLHRTYQPTASRPFVPEKEELVQVGWTKLVVHAHEPGKTPDKAFVDFSAYFTEKGQEGSIHEKAEFVRTGEQWIYTRAVRSGPAPLKSASPTPGRNDPCPCGSGKKYKHCCLK